jgi:hypothetical protein
VKAAGFVVIRIPSGTATVERCTINGSGTSNDGCHGIWGDGTFTRNDIFNVENGITCDGGPMTIRENFIHDLKASGAPHYDGIQIDGGRDIVVENNYVLAGSISSVGKPTGYNQTSAVMIDDWAGAVSNVKVNRNWLGGGGYTCYADASFPGGGITGVEYTNNVVGLWTWGPLNANGANPVWTGNKDLSGKGI